MARKLLAGILVLLAAATLAVSQQSKQADPDEEIVIRGGVSLVNVLASVRGKGNALIANLEQKDFKVFEDGKEQEIRDFARETNLPLTIGMLIDVSGSMEGLISLEQRAGGKFFEQVLRKDDMAFIISFGKDAELLQDLTNSTRLLQRGLDDLKLNTRVSFGGGPVPTAASQAGTVLFDAVYLAADERLRRETGRKVIVLITDGDDTGSQVSRQKAIEAAQKADAIIYGIFYAAGPYMSDKGTLERMAQETGGRVFDVGRGGNLDAIFKQIQDELRTQYSLSYSPSNEKKDGSYRKIEIKMANKDYKVQARKGYYAIEQE